jgi:hypothetical protein
VITTDTAAAKIGRSMKKCEKRIAGRLSGRRRSA